MKRFRNHLKARVNSRTRRVLEYRYQTKTLNTTDAPYRIHIRQQAYRKSPGMEVGSLGNGFSVRRSNGPLLNLFTRIYEFTSLRSYLVWTLSCGIILKIGLEDFQWENESNNFTKTLLRDRACMWKSLVSRALCVEERSFAVQGIGVRLLSLALLSLALFKHKLRCITLTPTRTHS